MGDVEGWDPWAYPDSFMVLCCDTGACMRCGRRKATGRLSGPWVSAWADKHGITRWWSGASDLCQPCADACRRAWRRAINRAAMRFMDDPFPKGRTWVAVFG